MRNIWTIALKEYKHFFISPIAYVIAFAILLFLGIIFYGALVYGMNMQIAPSIQVILNPLVMILLFATPAITMRSLAEEQKAGTLEILLTAPVRDWEVVAGKWLGGVLFLGTILLISWFYPIILNQIVEPGIDQGLMVSGYLGIFLLGSAFMAVGVMASSFFSNQIAAFFAALGALLVFWVIGYPAQAMGSGAGELLRYFDFTQHFFPTFFQGVISLKDTVFFISVIAVALLIGSLSVEARRWR